MRKKFLLSKKDLFALYHLKKKSTYSIGKIYRCSRATISNRIREYKIPLKSRSEALMKCKKFDFSGNLAEKSYLIGFRIGDLNVYKTSRQERTVKDRWLLF